MKNAYLLSLLLCLFMEKLNAQALTGNISKPALDTNAFSKWPMLGNAQISNDGKYAFYTIEDLKNGTADLVVHAIALNREYNVKCIRTNSAVFTADSRHIVFSKAGDSLGIIVLATGTVIYKGLVNSFKTSQQGSDEWVAYQSQDALKRMTLANLTAGKETIFGNVTDYLFSENGKGLLFQSLDNEQEKERYILRWLDLSSGEEKIIRKGRRVGNFNFDVTGNHLSYLDCDTSGCSIWTYDFKSGKEVHLSAAQVPRAENDLVIENIVGYSNDSRRLFIYLKEKERQKESIYPVKVDVWNYKDIYLQSQQLENPSNQGYLAVFDLEQNRLIRLQQENDIIRSHFPGSRNGNDNWLMVLNFKGNFSEAGWNPACRPSIYLINAKDGSRRLIRESENGRDVLSYDMSPEGRYLVYYVGKTRNYYSYEIATGTIRNVTGNTDTDWSLSQSELPEANEKNIPVAAWIKDKDMALIYDQHDIWLLDLTGKKPPVNITNGFGRKHQVKFSLALDYPLKRLSPESNLLLSAFNTRTKENGFASGKIEAGVDPELLTMGNNLFCYFKVPGYVPFRPVKAMNTNVFIVKRESAAEFPNYFYTKDFKVFVPMSNFHPEKDYNWLTSELITWDLPNGKISQGVLYKPENFDPEKKYPVIFHYYEKLSNQLNLYHFPKASDGDINIPWFVSNGYLVFTPDIHYEMGEPGKSAYLAMVSAAEHLSKEKWIDPSRMGLQGHSFGGFETNYIITRTNLFAAACSACGISNFVSYYGELLGGSGESVQGWFENDQGRLCVTPWQKVNLYLDNSPVLFADKISTPLLLMSNKNDGAVSFSQGLELFMAMRRLQKKVWLLQYDDGSHVVDGPSAIDFTIRLTQFFDYYLKGAPAPKWMKEGVPARFKGVSSGFEFEQAGKQEP